MNISWNQMESEKWFQKFIEFQKCLAKFQDPKVMVNGEREPPLV